MKYTEDNVPSRYRVIVRHYHDGNSTAEDRYAVFGVRNTPYATEAELVERETGELVSIGQAVCHSHLDQPNRKRGRAIAIGRALSALDASRDPAYDIEDETDAYGLYPHELASIMDLWKNPPRARPPVLRTSREAPRPHHTTYNRR